MMKFPPKSINSLIGYRTKQSKSLLDKFRFSQVYSAIQLMKSGVIGCLIAFGSLFIESEVTADNIIALLLVLAPAFYPIYKTEKTLKLKFGK